MKGLGFPKSLHLFENKHRKTDCFLFQEEIMKSCLSAPVISAALLWENCSSPNSCPILNPTVRAHAGSSHEIAPNSKRLLDQHGIDSSSFRAKRVTPQIAQGSDLILCFEHEQRKEIAVIAPTAARKTFLINDFANMCVYCKEQGYMGGNTRQEKLESVIDNASMIRPMIPIPTMWRIRSARTSPYIRQHTMKSARLCIP